jgi:hypothetical protein
MHIPKTKQIQGLRKALANRKTPRQFLPSLRKRLAKLTAIFIFGLCGVGVSHAQGLCPSMPLSAVTSTGTALVGNCNQSIHVLTYINTTGATTDIRLEASLDNSHWFAISDDATDSITGTVIACGYYPYVRVNLVTYLGSGSLTAYYSGSAGTACAAFGTYNASQPGRKTLIVNQSSDSIQSSPIVNAPYGSMSGWLVLVSAASLSSTATVLVSGQIANESAVNTFSFTLNAGLTFYYFPIPANPATGITLVYTPGSMASTTFSAYYIFNPPGGQNLGLTQVSHITGTTATSVFSRAGTLLYLTINTPAAGTLSVFDLVSGSCTGTPATNTKAILTSASGQAPLLIPYDMLIFNGLCIKASAAMDITVGYQ